MCSRFVSQRRRGPDHTVSSDRDRQGCRVSRPVPARVEMVQRRERRIAVCEAPARNDQPPGAAAALTAELHGAGVPGFETSTAKAMLLIWACESRSMTWMTRL